MNDHTPEPTPDTERDWRQRLRKSSLMLPADRVRSTKKATPTRTVTAAPVVAQAVHSGGAEYLSVKGTLHQRLLDELDRRNLLTASEETLAQFVETFVAEALQDEDLPLNEDERRRLVGDLLEETLGVGPLASLMADPAVTDILVNKPHQVYVERLVAWRRPMFAFAMWTTWCGSSSGLPPAWAGGSTKARRWWMRVCPTAVA